MDVVNVVYQILSVYSGLEVSSLRSCRQSIWIIRLTSNNPEVSRIDPPATEGATEFYSDAPWRGVGNTNFPDREMSLYSTYDMIREPEILAFFSSFALGVT